MGCDIIKRVTIKKHKALFVIPIVLGLAVHVLASETSGVISRPFVEVSGGSNFFIEGVGDDPIPSFRLGIGYRWSRLALSASFIWMHNLDWSSTPLCDFVGINCIDLFGQRDLFGWLIAGQLHTPEAAHWLQPYVIVGAGMQFFKYGHSSDEKVALAFTMRCGVGAEFVLSGLLSLSIELTYAYSQYDSTDYYTGSDESHSLITSGGLVIYF